MAIYAATSRLASERTERTECNSRAALRSRMLFLAASATSFIANGPQGLSPHGWVLFGERAPGHPLYAHHGAGSLNTHRYDATWQLRLLDSDGTDITDAVQRARADAPEGEAFWLGCCGADPVPEYLLPQLAGSYFDRVSARRVEPRVGLLPDTFAKLPSPAQPQLTRVDNLPLYRGYNDPNAEATAAFKAAGKPVQHYANGDEVPTEPGPVIFSGVTAVFEKTINFRAFDQIDPRPSALTYHLIGTNSEAFLQHRIAGFGSSWSQVLPVSLPAGLLSAMAAMPAPAETTLAADGTYLDTTAMRTLDVAHGGCLLRVPGRADDVEGRLQGGDEVDVEIECEYYCSTSPPRRCLNDFEPLRSLSNNGLFPTTTFTTRLTAGAEQGLLADNLLMLPGAPSLVRKAAAAAGADSALAAPLVGAPPAAPAAAGPASTPPSFAFSLAATAGCVLAGVLVGGWLALRLKAAPQAGGEALYTGPRSDQPEGGPRPAAGPLDRATALRGCVALVLGTGAAYAGAAALSGGSAAAAAEPRYLPGTVLAPFKPESHIFSHGFESSAGYKYSMTALTLPVAENEQTHEIYFDPGSHTAFVSMVTSSRLLQVPFDSDGKLHDHVREWTVGHPLHNPHPEKAGLHNIAASTRWPGHLWIATETDDRIYLVDPSHGFAIKYTMHTPTKLVTDAGIIHHVGGEHTHVPTTHTTTHRETTHARAHTHTRLLILIRFAARPGPHSVREGPDGTVWVALKGSNFDGPNYDDPVMAAFYKTMMDEHFLAEGEAVPDGWAVWHVDPELYDATLAPGRGGTLYEALESPTMTAIDGVGNAWTTQDHADRILHIDTKGVATQVAVRAAAPTLTPTLTPTPTPTPTHATPRPSRGGMRLSAPAPSRLCADAARRSRCRRSTWATSDGATPTATGRASRPRPTARCG